jgi:hypothetical protein
MNDYDMFVLYERLRPSALRSSILQQSAQLRFHHSMCADLPPTSPNPYDVHSGFVGVGNTDPVSCCGALDTKNGSLGASYGIDTGENAFLGICGWPNFNV